MHHAPLVLRALCGSLLPVLEGPETDDVRWWTAFRAAAEADARAPDELVHLAHAAIAAEDPRREDRIFVAVRAAYAHALEEGAAPAAFASRIEARGDAETVVTVTLAEHAAPSAKAMAIVQGALLGFGAHVAQRASATDRDARACAIAVGPAKASFVERLIARGLDDDAIMLGLDADKLGRLVDGAAARAKPTAALSMRALETDLKLTPTQARLALRLAEGASLREAAERLDMRYATARVHLKAVFAKAGVRTQAALVAKLLGGGA